MAYGLCGLTPEQFGHMTPARFYRIAEAKIKERNEEWKFMDRLNAVHCAVLANVNRGANAPAFSPDTFRIFPDRKKSTPEEIVAAMDGMAARQQAGE